jgi:hypothetical protein
VDEASIVSASASDMWTDSSFLSPEPLFLSELLAEEEKRIYSTTTSSSNNPSTSPSASSLTPLLSSRALKQESLVESSKSYEISYLLTEVERLKESNIDLSSKLMNVTEELNDVKAKMQSLVQLLGNHVLVPRDNNGSTPLSIGIATPP